MLLKHFWTKLPPHFRPIIACEEVVEYIADKDDLVYNVSVTLFLLFLVVPLRSYPWCRLWRKH